MPWNDNANPGPWGSPSGDGDRKDSQPKRPQGGGGPGRPGGPNFGGAFDGLNQRLRGLLGGPGGLRPGLAGAVAGFAVFAWAASGVYQVAPNEQALITTFGAYTGSAGPGLNYHLPMPIQRAEKVPVTTLNRTDVGGQSGGAQGAGDAQEESLMLTGDEQIIDLDFSVTWRVSDPARYLFAIRAQDDAVKAVAESAMREVIGKQELQSAMSTGRGQVQLQTAELMQKTLDSWGAGITVVEVQIRKADPPPEVATAFREVNNALQDADSAINEANTYRNRVINEAKGDASTITNSAQAYREQSVREATGEASRFNQIVGEYRRAPGVTRDRLYIETMQRILTASNKVVIDAKGASAPIILPPDAFRPKGQATPPPPVQQAPAEPQQRGGQ